MHADPYDQTRYRCRLEWGRDGARRAAARRDILVIVDVLSFSTAVATALEHGVAIHPCAHGEDGALLAGRVGAELAVHRRDVPAAGRFSLSPISFLGAEPGTRVVLPSPNGATCSRHAPEVPHLLVGALVNASAVARALRGLLDESDHPVTVVACGERWSDPGEDGELRFAIEDYLGAGAVISRLDCSKSPEALLCEHGFLPMRDRLEPALLECGSGWELIGKGYRDDVIHASKLDMYTVVPAMHDGALLPMSIERDGMGSVSD